MNAAINEQMEKSRKQMDEMEKRAIEERKRFEKMIKEQAEQERKLKEEQMKAEMKLLKMKQEEETRKIAEEAAKKSKQEKINLYDTAKLKYDNQLDEFNQIKIKLGEERKKIHKQFFDNINGEYGVDHDHDIDEKEVEYIAGDGSDECLELDDKVTNLQNKLDSMSLLIVIGHTGLGKSTFLNRLYGDDSEEGEEGPFKTGDSVKRVTTQPFHQIKKINDKKYIIVDTPGTLDTENEDEKHKNNIAEYLRGCRGVNSFLLFYSLPERINSSYIDLLLEYTKMLDDNQWWKHVIIVATKLDMFIAGNRKLRKLDTDGRIEFIKNRREEIRSQFLNDERLKHHIPKGTFLPVVEIGHDNFEEAIKRLLELVQKSKFDCKNITSPIDELQNNFNQLKTVLLDLESDVKQKQLKMEQTQVQIDRIQEAINQC